MNYILFAFAVDFVRAAVHGGPAFLLGAAHGGPLLPAHYGRWRLNYVLFAALNIAAPLLALAAAAHRRLGFRQVTLQPIAN